MPGDVVATLDRTLFGTRFPTFHAVSCAARAEQECNVLPRFRLVLRERRHRPAREGTGVAQRRTLRVGHAREREEIEILAERLLARRDLAQDPIAKEHRALAGVEGVVRVVVERVALGALREALVGDHLLHVRVRLLEGCARVGQIEGRPLGLIGLRHELIGQLVDEPFELDSVLPARRDRRDSRGAELVAGVHERAPGLGRLARIQARLLEQPAVEVHRVDVARVRHGEYVAVGRFRVADLRHLPAQLRA